MNCIFGNAQHENTNIKNIAIANYQRITEIKIMVQLEFHLIPEPRETGKSGKTISLVHNGISTFSLFHNLGLFLGSFIFLKKKNEFCVEVLAARNSATANLTIKKNQTCSKLDYFWAPQNSKKKLKKTTPIS